jgi:hypothetical protein
MYTETFESNGATVSIAELVSPHHLRALARAKGMTGPQARRLAQGGWELRGMTSEGMLDAIATTQTQTAMQLMPFRTVEGDYGVLVYQVGHHQYRFVLPLYESASRELLSALAQKGITITWHPVDGGAPRTTKHQLSSESVLPVINLHQRELANRVEDMATMLATALEPLTSRGFIPNLIDGVSVKAVYVAIVYELDRLGAIENSLV